MYYDSCRNWIEMELMDNFVTSIGVRHRYSNMQNQCALHKKLLKNILKTALAGLPLGLREKHCSVSATTNITNL